MYQGYYGNQPGGKMPPTMPKQVAKKAPPPLPVSLHEMQLNELRAQASGQPMNYSNPGAAPAPPPTILPVTWRGVYDSTLYLDSAYRNSVNGVQYNQMTFQVKPLNNGNDLSSITHISVEPFYFPRLNPVGSVATVPDAFYLKRVMLLIDEIPSTAAVGTAANNQFHFEFAVGNTNSISVELVPVRDTIYFQVPIQTLSSITLRFLMPPALSQITLPPDVITVFMMPPNPNNVAPPPPPYIYTPGNLVKFAFSNADQWAALSNINVSANTPRLVLPPVPTPFATTPLPTEVATWGQNIDVTSTPINNTLNNPLGRFIVNVGDPITVAPLASPPNPFPVAGYYLPYGYFEIAGFDESQINTIPPLAYPPINPILYPGFIQNSVGFPVTFQIRKNRIAFQMRFSSVQSQNANGLIASHH